MILLRLVSSPSRHEGHDSLIFNPFASHVDALNTTLQITSGTSTFACLLFLSDD